MMRRRTLLGGIAGGLTAGLAPHASAHGGDRPPRVVGLHRTKGWLGVSVGLQDLFQPGDDEKLRSGFATRVLIRVELFREGVEVPLARTFRRSDVAYDLWDERFRVSLMDVSGRADVREEPTQARAVELATTLVRFPVAELTALRPGARHFLWFRADLNPLSEDLVAELRRWLVRQPGAGRTGDSFFGSFVSVFVNPRIEESERFIRFRSPLLDVRAEPRR